MRYLNRFFILVLCCFCGDGFSQGEPGDHQIHAWATTLSIKKDPLDKNVSTVLREISEIDSAAWCRTFDRLNKVTQEGNIRSQIRLKFVWNSMRSFGMKCANDPALIDNFHDALQAAYEIEDEALQYTIHLGLGQIYNGMSQYGLAAMHFQLYFEILKHNNRSELYLPSGAFYDMSYSLYHTHDYEGCIRAGQNALFELPNALFLPDDTLNTYQQMQQWNTIGLAYHKINKPDSSFIAFRHAEKIARSMKSDFWVGVIKGNMGDMYFDLGQYDDAYPLLRLDYENSVAANQYDNAANSLQWMARIDVHKGRLKEALQKLYSAHHHLKQMPQANFLANVDFAFTQAYAALGRADSVNVYMQQYLHLHDSLETEITKSQTDILQMQMSNLNQIQAIKILNRQKQHIAFTRNFTIAIVILLGCLGYMWLMRLRLKMQIRQSEAIEGKRLAEAETQKAIEQLDIFRQHLLEKNTLIEKMQTASEDKETSEDLNRRLSELSHHLILNEDDWDQFKTLFDSVYPGFFHTLRNKVPDITQAEQRMSALIKLKLTAREAANLLGISPNTVYKTRQRLRQRLGLEQDGELDTFFEG